jgi:hypothetical protein
MFRVEMNSSSQPEHPAPVFVMRSGDIPVLACSVAPAFLSVIPSGNLLLLYPTE